MLTRTLDLIRHRLQTEIDCCITLQCLGGMAQGPCGEDFKAAFSCFVHSNEEPKGVDCVEKFKAMQDCFRKHPDVYGDGMSSWPYHSQFISYAILQWFVTRSCVVIMSLISHCCKFGNVEIEDDEPLGQPTSTDGPGPLSGATVSGSPLPKDHPDQAKVPRAPVKEPPKNSVIPLQTHENNPAKGKLPV